MRPRILGVNDSADTRIIIEPKFSGFVSPTSLTSREGISLAGLPGDDHLYVTDQIGIIYLINPRTSTSSIFLDLRESIPDLFSTQDDRGLLGLAFHPDYQNQSRFFVYYTSTEGNRLSEVQLLEGQFKETILIDQLPQGGGDLKIGPDSYLYLTISDPKNIQSLTSLLGKIIRLDISQPGRYQIPPDNPWPNSPEIRPEIWAYGFQYPDGLSFAQSYVSSRRNTIPSGDQSDQGQMLIFAVDGGEVNLVKRGSNYGKGDKRIEPIYRHDGKLVGGYYIENKGYVFSDLSGSIMTIIPGVVRWSLSETVSYSGWVRGMDRDGQGNLYLLSTDRPGLEGQGFVSSMVFLP